MEPPRSTNASTSRMERDEISSWHGHNTQPRRDSSGDDDLFYAQLGRGASALLLRSASSLAAPHNKAEKEDHDGLGKAKEEAETETDNDDHDDHKAKEAEAEPDLDEAESEEKDTEKEKEKAEQMRRDEAMARQLQIQFLREDGGFVDDELLRQLVQSDVPLPAAPADNSEPIECAICCDEKPPSEIYTYFQCGHRYCTQCLREYYATHIKEGDVKLRCPYPNCPTAVLPMQITAVVTDAALLQKYNQFAWFDQVKSNPNTRWCTKPGCETVLTRQDDAVDQKVVCSGCETVTCFLCGDEWHEGFSCQGNRDRKVRLGLADTSVEDYAKKNVDDVRICPRCAVPIEKNKGCNTMTCSFCGCAFCWLCGQVMTPGHFSQKGPCKGKDGEAKWLKATVYTIIAVLVLTLPVWAGPAYVVYKMKQRKKKRQLARAEMQPVLATSHLPTDTTTT